MKMKKLLALLVMAVLSISAASAVTYPKWWEDMNAGESLTMGSYSTINAYADKEMNPIYGWPYSTAIDSKTATTTYNVNAEGKQPIAMTNTITTYGLVANGGAQTSDVYRQLLSQTGSASVWTGSNIADDSENPDSKVTEVEEFEQEQVALFSGRLDCPEKIFGATFTNNNVVGTDNVLHQTSGYYGDSASVYGYGYDTNIIEAFAGQSTSGSLVEVQSNDAAGIETDVYMSGAASLYAGFDNAVVGATAPGWENSAYQNSITVKLNNDGGDKFWWNNMGPD
jgi:hypothetical protein